MPRKKKEPEPVELEVVPKKTALTRTKEIVKNNPTAIWRTFQASLLGLLIFLADNGKDWIKAYMEKQKTQTERQAAWQAKSEARFQILSTKLDSLISFNKSNSKTKIK